MSAFTRLSRWLGVGPQSGKRGASRLRTGLWLEQLEDRLTPALQLLYGGAGTPLSLHELTTGSDSVTVAEPTAGVLRINLGAGTFAAGSSTVAGLTYQNAGSPTTSSFVDVSISTLNAVSTLSFDLGAGTDSLALGMTNTVGGVGNLTVTDSSGSDTLITLNSLALQGGNLNVSGGPIAFGLFATVVTNGGKLALTGTGTAARSVGIDVTTATLDASGGNILLTGTGVDGTSNAYGIDVLDGAQVRTSGTGTVTLNGTGGNGTDANYGVFISGNSVNSAQVIATAGNLSITGTGQGISNGIGIWLGRQVSPGAVPVNVLQTSTGNISLLGTGANGAGGGNSGFVLGANSGRVQQVTTTGGNISITGVGQGSGAGNAGIRIGNGNLVSAPRVQAGGSGTLTLNGTSTTGNGVDINNALATPATWSVLSAGGALTITGTTTTGNFGYNVAATLTAGGDLSIAGTVVAGGSTGVYTLGSITAGGNITVTGAAQLAGINIASTVAATGTVTLNGSATGGTLGSGSQTGVFISTAGQVTTVSGAVSITGTSDGADNSSRGVGITNGALVRSGGSGALTIHGAASNSAGGNRVHGVLIGTGSGATVQAGGALSITGSTQATGGGTAGNASDGINISGATVTAGTTVTLAGTAVANAGFANAGVRIVSGRITAGGGDASKNLGLAPGSAIVVNFDPAQALTAGYDYVNVQGTVDLGGADLQATKSGAIAAGDQFLLLNNDLVEAITGMFAQGNGIAIGNQSFALDYAAGMDSNDVVATAQEALSITTGSLPNWTRDVPYTPRVTASGGSGPITFAVSAGALPTGLTLNSDGTFSGTPTAGVFTFAITATDAFGAMASRTYTNVTINEAVSITTPQLPNGMPGVPYTSLVASSGGTGARTYAVTAGSLPPGLSLNPNGTFSGRPRARGTFTFTITATDSVGGTGMRNFTVIVTPVVASTFRFLRQPTHALAGTVLAPVVVQLTDRFGNPIARAGVAVTLRLSRGRLFGTVTRRTDAQGRVRFTDLRIVPPGRYRLTVVAPGLTPINSAVFTIGPMRRGCYWA